MKKVELTARCIAPPRLSLNLSVFCPLFVKLMFPLKVSMLLRYAEMAPPCIAELLLNLLAPSKFSDTLATVKIAPPLLFAELLMKLLVPVKVSKAWFAMVIAPPL